MNRSVLVTGASRGLGAAIARAFHLDGYRVCVSDVDAEAADAVARSLDPDGHMAIGTRLDVTSQSAFEAARDQLVATWGSIDVLVNNAALTIARPVFDIDPDEFDAVSNVNLRGTFFGCRVLGSYFKGRGEGRIINVASLAGQNGGTATGAHYAASKGGIIALTKSFARELAAFGVTVNAVAPGPLDLPSVRALITPGDIEAIAATIPVRQLGAVDFVAKTIVHLASPEAVFVCGATWDVNGGLFMR